MRPKPGRSRVMDGWDDKARQEPVGFTQRVRNGANAAWNAVRGLFKRAGRFIYNHAITVFLVLWIVASLGAVKLIMYLADPCRGTNLVCPGVEWIRPGYLAEDFRNLLWAASLVFGGAGAGAALINALRRTRLMQAEHALAQRGQDAETFSRAVNQLGSEQTAIRLGAIYALEGLMRSAFTAGGDKAFGRQIGETLAAFVREQSAEEARREAGQGKNEGRISTKSDVKKEPKVIVYHDEVMQPRLFIDREAAVLALARSWVFECRPLDGIDLSDTRLRLLRLPDGADLRLFNFTGADLDNARLFEANLQKSKLVRANFEGAQLDGANLCSADASKALFSQAVLIGGNFAHANLQQSVLISANLQFASFKGRACNGQCFRSLICEKWTLEMLISAV
ncbi:hypothetical protein X907_1041 [Glycocaulis alkaliphilus]|uniref:Pentapeptide repeat-containing protein n=2 Tax=Glycocaulis alkaliphilus TaxID=1434191 RepID=A0A3T0E8L1_9PROT|nr:hypothetical protein X907_1041 [Glycocaulis alkaliphilus]